MNTSQMRAMYRKVCRHRVTVRRWTGTGAEKTKQDFEVRGHARLHGAKEIAGEIKQGDYRVTLLAEDLTDKGFPFPLLVTDKVVVRGRERGIIAPQDRSSLDDDLIAYELSARG